MDYSHRKAAAFAVALCCARGLVADESPAMTVVVTGTRVPAELSETPTQTLVVDGDALRESGASDLGDALLSAGVSYASNAMGSDVVLQGMGAERVLILVDGRRLAGRVAGKLDAETVPIENVERVEIVRGPQSALYGSDAIGGVINIITKKPAKEPALRIDLRNVSLPVADSSDAPALSALREQDLDASLDLPLGVTANRFTLSGARASAYKDSGDIGVYPETRRLSGGLESTVPIGDGASLGLGGSYSFARRDDYTSASGSYDRIDTTRAGGHGRLELETEDGAGVSAGLDYQLFARDKSSYNGLLGSSSPSGDEREDYATADLGYTRFVGGRNELSLFLSGAYGRVSKYNIADGESHDRLSAAISAQDEFFAGERSSLLFGARAEYSNDFGAFVAPKASARLELGDSLRVMPAVGLGYRAPSFLEMYLDSSGAVYHKYGNPDLRPEKSVGASVGADWFKGRYVAQASVYHNELFDEIAYDYTDQTDPHGLQVIIKENLSRSSRSGVDLSAEAKAKAAKGLSYGVRYAYLFAWDRSLGKRIDDQSAHRAGAWVRYGAGAGKASVRVGADLSSPNAHRADWLLVADARASVPLGASFELYGGANNLLGAVDAYADLETGPEIYLGIKYKL